MFPRRCIELTAFLLVLSVAIPFSAHAATLLVPEDYSLEDALLSSTPGDTVSVAGGTLQYGSVLLPPGIVLRSREAYTNTIVRLLAWNLSEPSLVDGFLFGFDFRWDVQPRPWLGVIVDNSEVSFVDCRFESLNSIWGDAGGWAYPRGDLQRYPLDFVNGSKVSLNSCYFHWNMIDGDSISMVDAAINSHECPLNIVNCVFDGQERAVRADGPVTITDSIFRNCYALALRTTSSLYFLGNLVVGCGPIYWPDLFYGTSTKDFFGCRRTPTFHLGGSVHLYRNTFVDNPVYFVDLYRVYCEIPEPDDRLALIILDPSSHGTIRRNLFIGLTGPAVEAPASIDVSCNDAWDGLGQYWTGGIGDVTGIDGNISQAPMFCGRSEGDYTLSIYSPAATAECGPMGAFPTACDTKLEIPDDGGSEPQGQPAKLQTRLLGAAPNPFNPRTQIRFELEHAGDVRLEIFDVAGRLVQSWSLPQLAAGAHAVPWDGHDAHGGAVASGVYYLRLFYEGKVLSDRMALLR